MGDRFTFDFDRRWVPLVRLLGIRERNSWCTWTTSAAGRLRAVVGAVRPGDRAVPGWRAIGPRLSLADRGLTFGTTAADGVCIGFMGRCVGWSRLACYGTHR